MELGKKGRREGRKDELRLRPIEPVHGRRD